jgi:hypothetical protein
MRLLLRRREGAAPVRRHTFDLSRPCQAQYPGEVAAVLGQILGEEMGRLAPLIAKALEAGEGGQGPPASSQPAGQAP